MNLSIQNSSLESVVDTFVELTHDTYRDFSIWVQRLDDIEKLFFIFSFILLLFLLILVKASSRPNKPGKGRSFFTSLLLVMVFSFGAGWIIDSRFDMSHFTSHFF